MGKVIRILLFFPRFFLVRIRQLVSLISQVGFVNALAYLYDRFIGEIMARLLGVFTRKHYNVAQVQASLGNITLDPSNHLVSFVIPTWNGMKDNLPALLQSIRNQNWPNIEIVAVDSESADETVSVLGQFGARVIPIKKSDFRHDLARNTGAKASHGKTLVFTVQDACFIDPNWVNLGLKQLAYYGATSYCTPQLCTSDADLYARYLSYNFIAANQYQPGSEVLGDARWGALVFRNSSAKQRQRMIHVDDVNHMVARDYFLAHPYDAPTCEDMAFGKNLIMNGEKFVFSTLSHVRHYHQYNNPVKYFTRVFLDNLVITPLIQSPSQKVRRDGVIDGLFYTSRLLFETLEAVFAYVRERGITQIRFMDIPPGTFAGETGVLDFTVLLQLLNERLAYIDIAGMVALPVGMQPSFITTLMAALAIEVPTHVPVIQPEHFSLLRNRGRNHLTHASLILKQKLGILMVTVEAYYMFLQHLLIDVLASNLAWYDKQVDDPTSTLLPRLKKLGWA